MEILCPIASLIALKVQRPLVHETLPASEAHAEGTGSARSAGGHHETAEVGGLIRWDRLGRCQVSGDAESSR